MGNYYSRSDTDDTQPQDGPSSSQEKISGRKIIHPSRSYADNNHNLAVPGRRPFGNGPSSVLGSRQPWGKLNGGVVKNTRVPPVRKSPVKRR